MTACVCWNVKAPTIVRVSRTVGEDCVQTVALVLTLASEEGSASMVFAHHLNVKKTQIARRTYCVDDNSVYPQTHVNQMRSATLASVVSKETVKNSLSVVGTATVQTMKSVPPRTVGVAWHS